MIFFFFFFVFLSMTDSNPHVYFGCNTYAALLIASMYIIVRFIGNVIFILEEAVVCTIYFSESKAFSNDWGTKEYKNTRLAEC